MTYPVAQGVHAARHGAGGADPLPSVQVGTQSVLVEVPGSNGKRLSLQNTTQLTGTQGAQLQLIPDANANPATGSMSEILLLNTLGQNYERFCLNFVDNVMVIGTSANGLGIPRAMQFQTGEWDPLNIVGIVPMLIHGDGTVDLNGSNPTVITPVIPGGATVSSVVNGVSATLSTPVVATTEWAAGSQANVIAAVAGTTVTCVATAGSAVLTGNFLTAYVGDAISSQITYGAARTRIYDPLNTGQTILNLDTCTTTPANTATTDQTVIAFYRGGSRKWQVGNNTAEAHGDTFDVVSATSINLLQVSQNGNIRVGLNANAISLIPTGVGVVGLSNASTLPSSNPTGGGVLYVNAGALTYRGSSGTVTVLGAA